MDFWSVFIGVCFGISGTGFTSYYVKNRRGHSRRQESIALEQTGFEQPSSLTALDERSIYEATKRELELMSPDPPKVIHVKARLYRINFSGIQWLYGWTCPKTSCGSFRLLNAEPPSYRGTTKSAHCLVCGLNVEVELPGPGIGGMI